MTAARAAGAVALLAAGAEHLRQYSVDHYSAIATIGTLFVLDFALLGVSGIGSAAGAIVGLLISERSGLFGFMEVGYRSAIVVSIVLETATVVLLGGFVAALRRRHARPSP